MNVLLARDFDAILIRQSMGQGNMVNRLCREEILSDTEPRVDKKNRMLVHHELS